jgi:glycosyltransferase involved in cell wall biosynthesis
METLSKRSHHRDKSSVLIVIPAYNEEESIKRVVEESHQYFPSADILVVDDGSSDRTSQQVLSTKAELLRLPCNMGVGAAIEAALKYADRYGYSYALRLDGDGQHNPDDAIRLLAAVRNGEADAALGSRFMETRWAGDEQVYRTTRTRAVGIRIFAALVSLLIGQKITDPTCGLRCYNRRIIRYLARNHPQDYPEVESIVVLHRAGFRLLELPTTVRPRIAGTSTIGNTMAIYYVFRVTLAAFIAVLRDLPGKIPGEEANVP